MHAPSALNPTPLGIRALAMIEELAEISAEPARLIRLYLSPEHRRAADLTARWMQATGMSVREDALGTVCGRWSGNERPNGKRLLIGSHLDTVIDAGKYDGPLGVIAGILAVLHFVESGRALPFGIDVLAFGDEEGSRFPSMLSTSAAAAGVFEPATLSLVDREGTSFAAALSAYGKDASAIPAAAYASDEAAGYVEVHIEQGPLLEQANEPLGVVTGIVGQNRLRVTVEGEAGHAGTVPMALRRDALSGAAEMVLALEEIARGRADVAMVATVGNLQAMPGATNVIPGRVTFMVDLRAMNDDRRTQSLTKFTQQIQDIARKRKLTVATEIFTDKPVMECSPALQDLLSQAIADVGCRPIRLPSGAGHDAQMMAKLCPSAMLFVRCRKGVSHNPAEHASPADMGLAIAALIRLIERFDPHVR